MRALCTISTVLVLAFWSLATGFIDAAGRPSLQLASRVEADPARDFAYLAKASRGPMVHTALTACSRPAVRSLASISLAELEAAYRGGDAAGWPPALAEAGRRLREGLGCFPYDGNLWLRLAAVDFARTGPMPEVEQMLALSARTAPSEAWIAEPRVALASTLADAGSTVARGILEADVRTLVARGHYAQIGRLYLQVGDASRRVVEAAVASLARGERRSELERIIAAAVRTLPPERQP